MANIVDINITVNDQYKWNVKINNIELTEKAMRVLIKAFKALEAIPRSYFDTTER